MASEAADNLRIELSGLNYLCNHALLGSKCLYRVNERRVIVIHIPAGFAAGRNRKSMNHPKGLPWTLPWIIIRPCVLPDWTNNGTVEKKMARVARRSMPPPLLDMTRRLWWGPRLDMSARLHFLLLLKYCILSQTRISWRFLENGFHNMMHSSLFMRGKFPATWATLPAFWPLTVTCFTVLHSLPLSIWSWNARRAYGWLNIEIFLWHYSKNVWGCIQPFNPYLTVMLLSSSLSEKFLSYIYSRRNSLIENKCLAKRPEEATI